MDRSNFLKPGSLALGANYWASHAGTNMWSDWREDVVESDFRSLSEYGVSILRVFPLWPDFQPITPVKGGGNRTHEFRFGDSPLPDNECGRAGVSEEACRNFETLCRIADKYSIKLIVGLLTGWMSGRTYTPQALDGINLFTDPVALMWEMRFVNYFVKRMKPQNAIAAWDLGNECNCMSTADSREVAWSWTSAITNAIKAQDCSRPVVSGMHGMLPEGVWTIQDQAEITDILTTHPYPAFTPYCDLDPINTPRGIMHSSAESRMYADIGGVPCIVEETGTLCPMNGSDATVAGFLRPAMFSIWAHDLRAMLWWCNSDFSSRTHPPYDYYMMERELGLFDENKQPKQAAKTIKEMREFVDALPFESLPPKINDAVCILTHDQDHWANAFGCFMLAKHSGIDINYQYADQPIIPQRVYLMPGVSGHYVMKKHRWVELLQRVFDGATLYISLDGGSLSEFEEVTGLQAVTRCRRQSAVSINVPSATVHPTGSLIRGNRLECLAVNAEVLGTDDESLPAFTIAKYGKGTVYVLLAPLEKYLATTSGSLQNPDMSLWTEIYKIVVGKCDKVIENKSMGIGVTEHELNTNKRIVVAINYTPRGIDWKFNLADGWAVEDVYRSVETIAAADAAVFTVTK